MQQAQHRAFLLAFVLPFLQGACVKEHGGAKIEMTLTGASAIPLNEHIELWARDGSQSILRVQPSSIAAYTIVQAVDFDDPCMIDRATGYLRWKKEAQPGPSEAE